MYNINLLIRDLHVRCLEQVILISKDMGDTREIASLAKEASDLFQYHGSADTAVLLLEKSANILQDTSTIDALRLLQQAVDVAMVLYLHVINYMAITFLLIANYYSN